VLYISLFRNQQRKNGAELQNPFLFMIEDFRNEGYLQILEKVAQSGRPLDHC
jgi:hypothetical protein